MRCRRRCSPRRRSGRWHGVPDNPKGWLITVATRRLTDQVRADTARRLREQLVVSLVPADAQIALAADAEGVNERDETLDLYFTCCHPALSPASQVALTLRAVGGLTTAEIARAFLVPEATMAQRLSRAKQTIKAAGADSPARHRGRSTGQAPGRAPRALSDLQRGLRRQRRRSGHARRAVGRSDPRGPAACRRSCQTNRRCWGCWP